MTEELLLQVLKLATKGGDKSTTDVPFEVGGKYYIRTVTYHLTGKVKEIDS